VRPVDRLLAPLRRFTRLEAASGIVLLGAAALAFALANSPWAEAWSALWQTPLSVRFGDLLPPLEKPLLLWVNDGLMAVFFWVVGLEIKRELVAGELREPRRAALPIVAAIGGMLVPGAIYAALHWGEPTLRGWAIPTATDIAFAIGVLALLGDRVPVGLKVFLVALAIVDDLGAVLVIAVAYTSHIDPIALAGAGAALAASIALNRLHVRSPIPYAAIGLVCWLATLQSGVHATVAGVLLAFTIPARTRIDAAAFSQRLRDLIARFDASPAERAHLLESIGEASEQVQTPLERLEHAVAPFSSFVVMPVFALANAGVALEGGFGAALASPTTLGVVLGLVLGKQIGVTGASWLAVKSGLATLPDGVGWWQIHGASALAGIGFTMSLFIAGLAFGGGAHGEPVGAPSPELSQAKLGILVASIVAGAIGSTLLARGSRR
jgi:NhaA family Na+:H+ antiporter